MELEGVVGRSLLEFGRPSEAERHLRRAVLLIDPSFIRDLQVVIIGADTPHVELKVLLESFRLLDENDIAVGPARDGGYYLLGLRSGWDLIKGLDMGSLDILDDLVATATHRGYSVGYVASTIDIDTSADLREPNFRAVDLNADGGFGDAS